MLHILSGPVKSGKTTRLQQWIEGQAAGTVAGILAPDREDGRYLVDIRSGEERKLSATQATAEKVSVGRFVFDRETFLWAQEVLLRGLEQDPDWLIVDEVGPLELRGSGLEPVLGRLPGLCRDHPSIRLLWVVREGLMDEVLSHYGVELWTVPRIFLGPVSNTTGTAKTAEE